MNRKIIIVSVATILFASLVLLKNFSAHRQQENGYTKNDSFYLTKDSVAEKRNVFLDFVGFVDSDTKTRIKPLSNGYITEIFVSSGQFLKKNDIIAQIDQKNYVELYEVAKAKLLISELNLKNIIKLKEKKFGSDLELKSAKADIYQAKSELKKAEINLENTKIKAPYDGILDDILIKLGDYVSTNTEVGNFFSNSVIKIYFYIPNEFFDNVKYSTETCFILDKEKVCGQKITFLSEIAEQKTNMYKAEIKFQNDKKRKIRIGEIFKVLVNSGEYLVHKIPSSSITTYNGALGVKVLDHENIPKFTKINVIDEEDGFFFVTGLERRAKIILTSKPYR